MCRSNILIILTVTFSVISVFCHPNKPRDSMASLNAELDQHELSHPLLLKFTGELLEDKTVKAGEVLELKCESTGSPPPAFYWTFNGKRIQGSSEMNIYEKLHNIGRKTIQNAVTISRMYIPCAQKENAGSYKCIASNGHKKIEKTAEVTIEESTSNCESISQEGPKIVQWTDARFENENNAAQLTCRANSPSATIAWYNDERKLLNNEENFEVFANGDLMIKNAQWDHMGTYTCVASNEFGEDRVEVFFYPTAVE